MEVDIALEVHRPGEEHAGRHDDPAAARGVARVDRLADGRRAIGRAVGDRTVRRDGKIARRELGRFDAGENGGHVALAEREEESGLAVIDRQEVILEIFAEGVFPETAGGVTIAAAEQERIRSNFMSKGSGTGRATPGPGETGCERSGRLAEQVASSRFYGGFD